MSPLRMLLRLMRHNPGPVAVFTLVNVIVEFALPIAIGLVTQAFFNAVGGGVARLGVWTALLLIVALRTASAVAWPWFTWTWSGALWPSRVLLQHNLVAGLLRGYVLHGLRTSPSEAISRFRDDPQRFVEALDAFNDLFARLVFSAGAAWLMWRIDATITVAVFVPIFLSAFVTKLLDGKTGAYHAASRRAAGRTSSFLGELIGAQLAVKIAGAVPHALARLDAIETERRRASVRASVFGQALDSINTHFVHLGTGLVLLFGARAIAAGVITVGDLALFVVYLDFLKWVPAEIGRVISDLRRVEVSASRMASLVPGLPPETLVAPAPLYLRGPLPLVPAPGTREPLERLEVSALTHVRPSGETAVADVSFVLERGSFTVVCGRIGAGKTTLLHVLLGLLPLHGGEIRWNGRMVDDPSTFFVPPNSAYTPQVPRLFSESVRENILLGRDDDGALDAAVHAAVLERDVATLERGLDTSVGPRGVKLSGGQVQRTAAARMFVRQPELHVFDDLSSALDAATEAELWARLFARGRDVTCLVVSHRPAVLRRADQVLVMDGGRLVAIGTLDRLLADHREMVALIG